MSASAALIFITSNMFERYQDKGYAKLERFPAPVMRKIRAVLLVLLALSGCRSRTQVWSIEEPISTFDPRVVVNQSTLRIHRMIFNGLSKLDANGEVAPDLAESFSAAPDLASYIFKLRAGVRFHNEHVLTSLDVKYTLETMLSDAFTPERRFKPTRSLAAIEVPDALTVVFKCNGPCPDLPTEVATIGIIPEGTSRLQASRPIGTGPYRLQSDKNEREFILVAHQDYFGGRPEVGRIDVKVAPAAP